MSYIKSEAAQKDGNGVPTSAEELGSFSDRLACLISEARGVSALARMADVSESVIRKWRDGVSEPSLSKLLALAIAANVTVEWLATGEGPMRQVSQEALWELSEGFFDYWHSHDPEIRRELAITNYVADYNREPPTVNRIKGLPRISTADIEAALQCSSLRPASHGKGFDEFALVTVYDVEASAGHGSEIGHERPLTEIAFRRDWLKNEGFNVSTLAALRARGDSMEPTIPDGSLLLIDTSVRQVRDGAIYVLRFDGVLLAKRLQRLVDGAVRVTSDNRTYAEEIVDADQTSHLDIVGRVIWIGHRA